MDFEKLADFSTLSVKNTGEKIDFIGKVEVVKQTGGPTLMIINDGNKSFTFKAFVKPGVRAYPEIDSGNFVRGYASIYERNDNIEGEVIKLSLLSKEDEKLFYENFENKLAKKAKPINEEFTFDSKVLSSLKDNFIDVATIIRKAILENRPIIIRHNADCDGYVSAITIERAILNFMRKNSSGDNNVEFNNYKRAPSKAPFYEYEDAVKDLINILMQKNKQGNKKSPLIIIADNGSTEEDLLSIKQMKLYDCQVVVVDHHFPGEVKDGKALVDEYIDGHINPYLKGYDSNTCAGMLGYELARFIDENVELPNYLPAVAGVADHSEGDEIDYYLEKIEDKSFDKEYLSQLAEVIDAEIYYIRFMEAREFVQDLFFNVKKQKAIVELLYNEIRNRYAKLDPILEKYAVIEKIGDVNLVLVNGEKVVFRGEYPAIGKSTNYIHKYYENKLGNNVVTGVYGSFFLTMRISDNVKNFSVPSFVKILEKDFKYINPSGGGHEHAGSVKFIEYGKDETLKSLKEYIKNIQK